MSLSFDLSVEVSEQYDFSKEALSALEQNNWVKNQWPLVYFIQNDQLKIAYVGESTNASGRIRNHLANPERLKLNKISIIGSDKFNKSATLDMESSLIQYIQAEGTFNLQNGNFGLINHNYYQQDLYKNLFKEVWNKLLEKKIVTRSLTEIENSELFKYSPYKSLNEDQYKSVLEILQGLTSKNTNRILVKGSAGTGKTILATYLMKLLHSDIDSLHYEDYNDDELREINYIKAFRVKYPNPKIGLVIAMTSLRGSLENVFKKIPGLKASMIINPSDTFKLKEKYDLLIVDEAHRLRKYKNISWMGAFKKNNQKLGLDDNGTELDWLLANSKNQLFFYDAAQSVKPSDVDVSHFSALLDDPDTLKLELKSQMRVIGGSNYINFVDDLLHVKRESNVRFSAEGYDLKVFDSLTDLYEELGKKEAALGLCRLVAGYSWPWLSKENKTAIDIKIEGLSFQWNQTDNDWINSENAFKEIGCIHTTQGYDLNYVGVIFGKEISYNKATGEIEIDPSQYYDINGKKGISDIRDLKAYIINIYKTIMYRGIRGTYVYACNPELREYLKEHIASFRQELPFRVLRSEEIKPYVNAVPFVDITAAAGPFGDLQVSLDADWVELPMHIAARKGYFICRVKGESMNKRIPNGAYCLFKQDEGGSRNGKIVLVRSTAIQDADFGSGYTVKEYHSTKKSTEDRWEHETIMLKPLSTHAEYETLELSGDSLQHFEVMGVFERVISLNR